MWNSTKYKATAIAAAGLAVAAVAPASAQFWATSGDYTVYGPNPWNQGPWGGPWLPRPWRGAAAQASLVPPQPAQPQAVVGGAYGCSTARPALGCSGLQGRR